MRKKKKKNIIKITLLILGVILCGIGVFWIGKKFGQSSTNPETPPAYLEQKTRLEQELAQLRSQLAEENDLTKRQALEQEIKRLEQQLQNLPTPPPGNPGPNGPSGPGNPPLPPNSSPRQFTIRFNTAIKDSKEFVSISGNPPERFEIFKNNPLFSSGIDFTDKNQHYIITFKEEEATEKKILKQKTRTLIRYIFDEKNTNFTLTLASNSPGPAPKPTQPNNGPGGNGPDEVPPNKTPLPSEDKIEHEFYISYIGEEDIYFSFGSVMDPDTVTFTVSKNNPKIRGKKMDDYDEIPNCQISFLKSNASDVASIEYYFDENNTNFTLTPLGNWPDAENEGSGSGHTWTSSGRSEGPRPDTDSGKIEIELLYDGEIEKGGETWFEFRNSMKTYRIKVNSAHPNFAREERELYHGEYYKLRLKEGETKVYFEPEDDLEYLGRINPFIF